MTLLSLLTPPNPFSPERIRGRIIIRHVRTTLKSGGQNSFQHLHVRVFVLTELCLWLRFQDHNCECYVKKEVCTRVNIRTLPDP
jgi:hypothetical protein